MHQAASGTILVEARASAGDGFALHARVSSSDQKEALDRQVARLTHYTVSQGWRVTAAVARSELGLTAGAPSSRRSWPTCANEPSPSNTEVA